LSLNRLLEKEKKEALEKNLDLQEKLDRALEKQECASKKLVQVQMQLDLALKEADRLRSVLKEEAKRLLQAC
jgi:hypothetical protein